MALGLLAVDSSVLPIPLSSFRGTFLNASPLTQAFRIRNRAHPGPFSPGAMNLSSLVPSRAFWGIILFLLLPNSPATYWGFSHDEKLIMIARLRRNQTGIEQKRINWGQIKEAYLDYKTWLFTLTASQICSCNGGTLVTRTLSIQGLGFNTFLDRIARHRGGRSQCRDLVGLRCSRQRYMPSQQSHSSFCRHVHASHYWGRTPGFSLVAHRCIRRVI